jgi:hypothetical protein
MAEDEMAAIASPYRKGMSQIIVAAGFALGLIFSVYLFNLVGAEIRDIAY